MMRVVLLAVLCSLLLACGDEQAVRLGPQQWEGITFIVESRPSPIRVGMNEFIVIATREHSKPGVGLVVSLRADPQDDWHQAIQDGFTGVYRRAVRVSDPQTESLAVHLRRGHEAETTLYFPLAPKGNPEG